MANLTSIETNKLQHAKPLQLSFNSVIKTGDKPKSQITSVKLVTEINKQYEGKEDALTFSYLVSNYIKADSRTKNADGKYAKTTVEEWVPAKIYHFSKTMQLSVDIYTEALFPTGGYIVNQDGEKLEDVVTRSDLSDVMESLIENNANQVAFLKYADFNGKKQIQHAYDPTVLILLKLLAVTKIDERKTASLSDKGIQFEKSQYLPIPQKTLVQCFLDAASELKARNYPLLPGTPIKSLSDMASKYLPTTTTKTK